MAFEAKPNSINKSNINKKLNVIKNAKKKRFIMCERGNTTIIHRPVKREHSNNFPVLKKQTWLSEYWL